ncbi:hypothetical protein ABKN59_002595 [Abortiporus biennis]
MSSKRGRKRNDNLPPNRARDVQRAFRARRAAHLEALEQRVAELEEENDTLRAALNLPPANRPPLGKGPTGKDKPKPYAPRSGSAIAERSDSPSSGSTRTHSLSPSSIAGALNPSPQAVSALDGGSWDDAMLLRKERSDSQSASMSAAYPITPVSTTTTQTSYSYPPVSANSSRQAAMAQIYMQPITQNYPHSADRPTGGGNYPDAFMDRRYSFSQPAFSATHDSSQLQSHSPTSAVPSIPSRGNPSVPPPISYAQRRSITEPQGYRPVVMNQQHPSMAHAQQQQQQQQQSHVVRIPSPGMADNSMPPLRTEYDLDSRVGRMS